VPELRIRKLPLQFSSFSTRDKIVLHTLLRAGIAI
jgi:hypothetical protein